MERYGFLVCGANGSMYIHPILFKEFVDCVRCAVTEEPNNSENIAYFKILKNSEIFKTIHDSAAERQYGFSYLRKSMTDDQFCVYSSGNELKTNLLEIVLEAKNFLGQDVVGKCREQQLKIGYFKILTCDEFLLELHAY